ncbi:SMP-30/gluconolactonase/LRE family protein [Schlesneria sp. T3-172]|uniref:SMP-30/gluconolactonase/LRE family protein n=1 Tax=Schlesneria TaxID=656899 RepID=UPI002F0DD9B7
MLRVILSCLAFALVCDGLTQAQSKKTVAVGKNPESVCRGFDGKLYVTVINDEVPGDGTVVAVDGETVTVFAKGFNAPKGIAFVGDYLVTADETTLWKIDKTGKATKLAEAKDFPHPIEFLNDVAAGKDGASVYVSEMSSPAPMFDPSGERKLWALDSKEAKDLPKKGTIYKVTLKGDVSVAVPAGNSAVRFPNGVTVSEVADEEGVFVGEFFSGEVVQYHDGKFVSLASGMRGIDGLTVTKDAIYASSWIQGKVWKVDRKTREAKVILEGLKSAADFYYDAKNKQLVVPDMISGTLVFLPL